MKVTITKRMKSVLTIEEGEIAKRIIEAERETDIKEVAEQAARIAGLRGDFEVLKATAEIAKNCRLCDYYGDDTRDLDIWLEVYAFNHYDGFVEVGAYLSDLNSYSTEIHDEITAHMYIRRYTEN